jgi:hypothetical protein
MVMPYTESDALGKEIEGTKGYSKIVNYNGRHTVLAWVRGTKVPFYISTGLGGKEGVESGKWYPHFGIGSDGWINKGGSEDLIKDHYGSKHLKRIANWLDSNVGDTRVNPSWFGGKDDSNIPRVGLKGPHINAINADMKPVELNSGVPVRNHGAKVLEDIHLNGRGPTTHERIVDSGAHIMLRQHAEKHPEKNLGTWLP